MTWHEKFMRIAEEISSWSKHPNTKVGCVIVNEDHSQLSGGYNGLPRGVDDVAIRDQSRQVSTTVHAEANAIASSARLGHSVNGAIAYVTHPVCAQCAALLIQAGIKCVIFKFDTRTQPHIQKEEFSSLGSWADSCCAAYKLFGEAGVKYIQYDEIHTQP